MVNERGRNLPEPWEERSTDPFDRLRRRMESMVDELDTFARRGFPLTPWLRERRTQPLEPWRLDMDLRDLGDHYELQLDLPGVDTEKVELTLHNDTLIIRGERHSETREEREGFLHSERYFGSFSRQVPLPPDVETERINANMEHGVLTLTMPKSAEGRGRRIDIH